jgi:hypothetical protein
MVNEQEIYEVASKYAYKTHSCPLRCLPTADRVQTVSMVRSVLEARDDLYDSPSSVEARSARGT